MKKNKQKIRKFKVGISPRFDFHVKNKNDYMPFLELDINLKYYKEIDIKFISFDKRKNLNNYEITFMRKIKPKIRKFTVSHIPRILICNNLNSFIEYVPINPKYYKLISAILEDANDYEYKNINFVFEKLQNLNSYFK